MQRQPIRNLVVSMGDTSTLSNYVAPSSSLLPVQQFLQNMRRAILTPNPWRAASRALMFGTGWWFVRKAIRRAPGIASRGNSNRLTSSWRRRWQRRAVAFTMRHRGHKLASNQVVRDSHDRNALRSLLRCTCCFGPNDHQYVRIRLNQLNCDSRVRRRRHAIATAALAPRRPTSAFP